MSKSLPLIKLPTDTLRKRSIQVELHEIGTAAFQTFIDDLTETMFVEDGVGIAASQVGKNIRVFIVNEATGPKAYINAEVELIGDISVKSEEGCLSVPGMWGIVPRAKKIHVRAIDRHARRVEFDVKGFMAIVFQHEFDHINGILFIDKAISVTKGEGKTSV